MNKLWKYLNDKIKYKFAYLMILMIGSSIAEVISIGAVIPFLGVMTEPEKIYKMEFVRPVLNFLNITSVHSLLLPITLIFILIIVISGLLRVALLWFQTSLGHGIGADISKRMYENVLNRKYEEFVMNNSSQYISAIVTKADGVVHEIVIPSLTLASAIFIIIAVVSVLFVLEPIVAAMSFIGFGLIYALVVVLTKKKLAAYGSEISKKQVELIKVLQEGFGGIRDVILDGSQEVFTSAYKMADNPLRLAKSNVQIISGCPRYAIEAFGMVAIACLAYFLVEKKYGISGALPILGAMALGAQRLLPLMQQVYSSWAVMRSGKKNLDDVLSLLENQKKNKKNTEDSICFNNSISLRNVTFAYGNTKGVYAIKGIDLEIKKGAKIGIIGETGSGKSTLIDILMGLLLPSKGLFAVDDVVINEENVGSWQKLLSHVPQEIYLSDGTISENIAFGKDVANIDNDRLKEAIEKSQLLEYVNSLPQKELSPVGERGVRLSGGQRQRIGIARALYRKSEVIILDEATSALDDKTEEKIIDAIQSMCKGTTIVMIAHRITTLRHCDSIYEIKDGQVIRSLTYGELLGSRQGITYE